MRRAKSDTNLEALLGGMKVGGEVKVEVAAIWLLELSWPRNPFRLHANG